ncbi:hypothetical protein SAMN05216199_3377 [Pedococcus cremeus]|uniref:Uncharacterized protein n=1 Tax=Pedococcus cremeus TaxID=587636 RepID=A0A1H9X2R8_9MICO|nr:hypothetical protein [Pedococcus cremeus]SES40379.1 hypothetical protein SAMN05216199_3377 [Pedococcus cremeus]
MPDDLRTLLERAEAPSMRVDPHAVLDGGRRRHRRRAALATTALAAAIGVLAVGAATVGDLGPKALRPASAGSTTSSGPAASSTATQPPKPVTARVRIEVGHCWVEDVVFDGQTWGLTDADQFGTGGGVPLRWEGTGVMVRLSAERARYTDDTGTVLNFLPVGDPSVFRMTGRGCL